jgi:hypothetical protein
VSGTTNHLTLPFLIDSSPPLLWNNSSKNRLFLGGKFAAATKSRILTPLLLAWSETLEEWSYFLGTVSRSQQLDFYQISTLDLVYNGSSLQNMVKNLGVIRVIRVTRVIIGRG